MPNWPCFGLTYARFESKFIFLRAERKLYMSGGLSCTTKSFQIELRLANQIGVLVSFIAVGGLLRRSGRGGG